MRFSGFIAVLFFGLSCATSAPPKPVEAPKPAPPPDLSNYGTSTPVGATVDIKGMGTIWLTDTTFVVMLMGTKWDEIDYGDGPIRQGRAKLRVWEPEGQEGRDKTVTIEEGKTKTVFGYKFKMLRAFEFYEENTGRHIPHSQFTISR